MSEIYRGTTVTITLYFPVGCYCTYTLQNGTAPTQCETNCISQTLIQCTIELLNFTAKTNSSKTNTKTTNAHHFAKIILCFGTLKKPSVLPYPSGSTKGFCRNTCVQTQWYIHVVLKLNFVPVVLISRARGSLAPRPFTK